MCRKGNNNLAMVTIEGRSKSVEAAVGKGNLVEEGIVTKAEPGHWLAGVTRYHWMVFACCWLGGIFDGMDSTLMSVAGPKAIAELIGTSAPLAVGSVASMVGSVFLLGWMLGGVLFGMMGDKLGRVRSMIVSILLYAIFTGLAGLAHNWPELAVCRFLTGLGIGGELVSISTFLTEVWPTRSRAVAIGALITSYQAGVLIAGTISAVFQGWRETFWVGALPAILVVFLRTALKESDRWIEAKEREKRADVPVAERRSHETHLFQRSHARSLALGGLAFGGLLIGYWASLSWIPFWIQSLLAGGGQGNERGLATMCQGLAAIGGCLIAGFAVDALGRRRTIAISSVACLVSSLLLFLLKREFSPDIYGYSALLGFFIGLNQAAMYIYLPELFPTLIRASGTGFCLNLGRLATAVSVFFMGDLMKWMSQLTPQIPTGSILAGISPYGMAAALFSFAYLLTAAGALASRETRGEALPD